MIRAHNHLRDKNEIEFVTKRNTVAAYSDAPYLNAWNFSVQLPGLLRGCPQLLLAGESFGTRSSQPLNARHDLVDGAPTPSQLRRSRDRAGKVAAQQETRSDETEKAAWCFPLLIAGGSAGDAQGNGAAAGEPSWWRRLRQGLGFHPPFALLEFSRSSLRFQFFR
ncbi:hypothetical protein Droror1_Dr00003085 [Drosera rotundifolia]